MALVGRIKDLCIKNETNISQLEKEIGLGNGTIARWDTASPTCANADKVAKYFDVTIDGLLNGV